MTETRKENKMGIMPVPKLLISMSLPMIISMLVQAFYNIVDSIFVAQISEDALTAVSLAFPIQNLMIAVAAGTGVGINALLSRSLGEKKYDKVNKIAQNGIFLALLSSIAFAIAGIFGSRFFFEAQTKDVEIIQYGVDYMTIITVASIGIFLQIAFERLMQSTGKTIFNMIIQGTGAIINIILDPILIFGWKRFGIPEMSVAGAAIATVTGQIIAAILGIILNQKFNKEVHITLKGFKPCRKTIGSIYQIGVPSILMQSIGSVTTFGMNKILLDFFHSTAAAVFGVYFKLQSFIFMPVFGLTNGIIPIVAYNYGARNKKRIYQTLRLGAILAVSIMFVGMLVFQLLPEPLLRLFDASDKMIEVGIPALRIISLSFSFAGFCIVSSSIFQALGNGIYSLIMSVARQLVVILPVAYLFAKLFHNVDFVWYAYPIAEIASVLVCIILLKRILKVKVKSL